jgi:hypothetical protein
LRLVATNVTGELVYKYDGEFLADIFVIKFDPIVGSHVRHNVSYDQSAGCSSALVALVSTRGNTTSGYLLYIG